MTFETEVDGSRVVVTQDEARQPRTEKFYLDGDRIRINPALLASNDREMTVLGNARLTKRTMTQKGRGE